MPPFDEVAAGQLLPSEERTVTQADVIRYAGASGDFNPLHWDAAFAGEVSPTGGVIVHGLLGVGHLARVLAAWAGGPERVLSLEVTFRAPWPVGATATLGGEVLRTDPQTRSATLAVWIELADGAKVVDRRRSRAVVRLD